MNKHNFDLWKKITFKTLVYRKNIDFINTNENIITECEGVITELRYEDNKLPKLIGEYSFSIWNIELGRKLNININKLIQAYNLENSYGELVKLIKSNNFDYNQYNKVIIIHTYLLKKEYRKKGITDELIEMFYRDYFGDKIAILMLVKPFQNNKMDADFFINKKIVEVKEKLNEKPMIIQGADYYELKGFFNETDVEMNEYKLFAIASRCGFIRLNNSYLFQFTPNKIEKRLINKNKIGLNKSNP
jgi:hypothetical protein